MMASAVMAFSFCLCASAVYIINDVVDLENDRRHPTKRHRPLASGAIPVTRALLLAPILLVLAFAVSIALLPAPAAWVLAAYFAITCLYTFSLKRRLLIDVFTLSGLYTMREIGGHASTGIPYSPWLLSFSIFLFLSLAFAKRVSEMFNAARAGASAISGRGYLVSDREQINVFGVGSGFLATLVFCLYINSPAVTSLYHEPMLLWLMCPVLLYWICRFWLIAHRGELNEDPILFASKDRLTYILGAVCGVILLAASQGW